MSRENVKIVKELLEAFQTRDHERAFDFYAADIEWDASEVVGLPSDVAGVFHGHDGVRTYWRRWLSAWRDLEFDVQDLVDVGDDVVLLIHNQRQWGRHSGIETELPPYAMVFTIRDRKVVRFRAFSDQRSALKAAGVPE